MRELLLGCGNSRRKRFNAAEPWDELVTIDHDPDCGADIVHDLEQTPWPLGEDEFDAVHAYCVLEHLGRQGDFRSFFATFTEIYRVLKPGGLLVGVCPSRLSKWAWGDPSHTRLVQPETFYFLDREMYAREVGKSPMTDFRWLWKGDFEPVGIHDDGEDFRFMLKAHKPARIF